MALKIRITRKARGRSDVYDLDAKGWFDALLVNAGLFDKDVIAAAAGVNGNAFGDQAQLNLVANTATAAGTATANGNQAQISLVANTATASSATNGNATGDQATVNVAANTATATGSGAATGNQASLNVVANTASASGSAVATGNQGQLNLVANTATATGTAGGADGNATGLQAVLNLIANTATATGTGQPTNGGAIIQNLRRHTERYRRRMEAEEKERQDNVDRQLKKIVAGTPKPGKALKAAYKAIRLGQDGPDNAEQRLLAYLLAQETEEEAAIIQLMAELL